MPPHNKCGHVPTGLRTGIHLGIKFHTHVGEGPRSGQVWKKKPDNCPKVNKDPEGLPYINYLTTSSLHSSSSRKTPKPFLSWSVSLTCFCLKQTVSLCALRLCSVSDNKFCTCFCRFCLFEKFIFQAEQEPRLLCFHTLDPGIPDFPPCLVHACMCVISCFSCVQLFATPWAVAHQAFLSMGFSRLEYWIGFLCPPPGDLPNPGFEPESRPPSAISLRAEGGLCRKELSAGDTFGLVTNL